MRAGVDESDVRILSIGMRGKMLSPDRYLYLPWSRLPPPHPHYVFLPKHEHDI